MKNFVLVLLFIALTAFCWGVYGPVLRIGQAGMAIDPGHPPHLKPFICVGVAYFVIAILVPGLLLQLRGEKGRWTARGTLWSLLSGAAGAIGALGIILAFANHGSPLLVMPLVFGCAPVVNTFYTMATAKGALRPGPLFFAGLIVVAAGAVTVLVFKPATAPAKPAAVAQASKEKAEATAKGDKTADSAPAKKANTKTGAAPAQETAGHRVMDMTMVLVFVALTALSWGVYGPVLHKGQMLMEGSRLRPLICVGISYFVIAVLAPVALMQVIEEHGRFTFDGSVWSLAGGAAGAVGALGIIMAFTFGGKPIYVMPLVFGCAPVINTFVSLTLASWSGQHVGDVSPVFYAGLIMVAAGAVTVLVFAPKAGHGPAPAKDHATPKAARQPA